ncbi:hypothetical protein Scep_005102 [Stephania cephalantha]|uniref:Hexosyltransferase n=1 Tax=Stephania cephalantha TaxID=152367 RepID=A0AAP0PW16_9MAGN
MCIASLRRTLSASLYPFRSSSVLGLISSSIRSALDCPLNYTRSYLPHLLPFIPLCLHRVVYLDSDLFLVDDIAKLSATPLEYCNANFTSYFTPTFWSNLALSLTIFDRRPCYFNTGVMVIDPQWWRAGGYTVKIEEWMELQKRMRIYELGSLSPFLLVFAGNIAPVDHRWNQHGLGGDNFRGLCSELHPGPILRWIFDYQLHGGVEECSKSIKDENKYLLFGPLPLKSQLNNNRFVTNATVLIGTSVAKQQQTFVAILLLKSATDISLSLFKRQMFVAVLLLNNDIVASLSLILVSDNPFFDEGMRAMQCSSEDVLESDQASLRRDCESKVHWVNFLVARHFRSLLCHSCQSTGAKLWLMVSVYEGEGNRRRSRGGGEPRR